MRGKGHSEPGGAGGGGITPAYAGKSMGALIADAAERDHPRVCGEKTSASSLFNTAAGSPPRVRGKELRVETCFSHDGITPAYAGKRVSRSRAKTGEWDHPRVCGEKTVIHKNDRIAQGSPPRVRGKVLGTGKGCDGVGITPACAGKRMVFAGRKSRTWDHPRVCGEKFNCNPGSPQHWGSPPRMRGKARGAGVLDVVRGITPACAGKRVAGSFRPGTTQDHPRVCGEKKLADFDEDSGKGSPPRVRGKAVLASTTLYRSRITPAYAGKRRTAL